MEGACGPGALCLVDVAAGEGVAGEQGLRQQRHAEHRFVIRPVLCLLAEDRGAAVAVRRQQRPPTGVAGPTLAAVATNVLEETEGFGLEPSGEVAADP